MALIDDINKYKINGSCHLSKMKSFYEKMSLTEAIKNASVGGSPDSKMDPHQRRVGHTKGNLGANELLKKEIEIQKCKSFAEIFEITEKVKSNVIGLGNLWSYDTALRIGFNLGKYPELVYIQAGVRKGVKKVNPKIKIRRTLDMSVFPDEMQILKPYEAENFLCIYGK